MPPVAGFQPARLQGKRFFDTAVYDAVAAQTFKDGAVLVFGTAGNAGLVQEAAANPATIVGTAMQAAFTNPGNELSHASQVVAVTGGNRAGCTVALARGNSFIGYLMNGAGGVIQTPTQAMVGSTFGIYKHTDGNWYVDSTVTGGANDRVKIVDIDIDNKFVIFTFLPANVA